MDSEISLKLTSIKTYENLQSTHNTCKMDSEISLKGSQYESHVQYSRGEKVEMRKSPLSMSSQNVNKYSLFT